MSEASKVEYMTPEEYLEFEERSPARHEYINGQVFVVTGAAEAHNFICGDLFVKIYSHLRGTGCRAFIHDMKVFVKADNSFYYPDIMVACEAFEPTSVFKSLPSLLVEVLSPSTKQTDRREKRVAYCQIAGLKEYVIIYANKMLIELYRKDAQGQWEFIRLHKDDELCLESLPKPLKIPVSDIYSNIVFTSSVEESEEDYEAETCVESA